jgi:hypothetical protein
MVDSSGFQRRGQLGEFLNIDAEGGHSGGADKVSEGLHVNYS